MNQDRTQYIGIVVDADGIQDVMLYPSKDECMVNLVDSIESGTGTGPGFEAKIFEHVDHANGDQTCVAVFDYYEAESNAREEAFVAEYIDGFEAEPEEEG